MHWTAEPAAAADMCVAVSVSFPLSLLVVAVWPGLRVHCTATFRLVGEMPGYLGLGPGMAVSCCGLGAQTRSRGRLAEDLVVRHTDYSHDLVVEDLAEDLAEGLEHCYSFHSHGLAVEDSAQDYSRPGRDLAVGGRDTVEIAPLVGVVWRSSVEHTLAHWVDILETALEAEVAL